MTDRDPLIDPPSWVPSWISVDNVRTVRNATVVIVVVLLLSLGVCVIESAGTPADPVLDPSVTRPVPSTTGVTTTTGPVFDECPVSAEGPPNSTLSLVDVLGTAEVVITFADGATRSFCVLVADEADERNRGLMSITDFTTVEGMVFLYDEPSTGSFFMFNTPTALSLTFWAQDGGFISRADMRPCLVEDPDQCERFPAAGPYTVALELPQSIGSPIVFDPDDTLLLRPTG